jgi:hypothetical protein
MYEEVLPSGWEVTGPDVGPVSPRVLAAPALPARYKGEDVAKAYGGID